MCLYRICTTPKYNSRLRVRAREASDHHVAWWRIWWAFSDADLPEFLDIDLRLAGPFVILRIGIDPYRHPGNCPHDRIRITSKR